jgi:apolipoprotein D and lipocalin family protein
MDDRVPSSARTRPSLLLAFTCLGVLAALGAGGCASSPKTVEHVDMTQFAGKWYEIAHFPQEYDHGCVATTSSYEPLAGDRAWVVNECREGSFTAPIKRVTGNAETFPPDYAHWRVQFERGPTIDYIVVQLDAAYHYAALGTPDRKGLWILSRTPTMPADQYDLYVRRLKEDHWDTSRLRITPQFPDQLPVGG